MRKPCLKLCGHCDKLQSRDHRYYYMSNGKTRGVIYHLKSKYNLTPQEAIELLERQNKLCAICKEQPATDIDHDHATNKVRGYLCQQCNHGLGNFKDNKQYLQSAIGYLK